jgi:CubicO group peptidase (beta-lactamase class C family)/formylmethanofuran dehydrogenase subunit E
MLRLLAILCVSGFAGVCLAEHNIEKLPQPHYRPEKSDPSWLQNAAQFHGHLGPMMVFGARTGMAALRAIDAKGYFDVEIKCEGPLAKPPASCFLDGLQIATGATLGKRNLEWLDGKEIVLHVKNTQTGRTATLRPTAAFLAMLQQPAVDVKGMSDSQRREQSRNSRHSDELSRKIATMPEKEILTVGHPLGQPGSTVAEKPNRAILDQIPVEMQKFVDRQQVSGAVTVVGTHDRILSLAAVGQRDIAAKQPMAPNTVFRIASMTKPVTAIGIMILVDEGKLSVDDDVERHLPEFRGQMLLTGVTADSVTAKRPSRKIKVRDLLTHTSGMIGWFPEGLADIYAKRNHTLAEVIMAVSQRPLEAEPGSRWAYCNPAIDTLGRIIEVVAGQPYEVFMRNRIFEPLGMTDTTFYPNQDQRNRLAVIYQLQDEKLTPCTNPIIGIPRDAKYPIPAGGLCSTGSDLARLYQMMLNGGKRHGKSILSEASLKAMTSPQTGQMTAGFVPDMASGFGWFVVRRPTGITEMLSPGTFGHGGAFGTQAWIDPQQDLFTILLIQRSDLPNADASDLRRELQRLAVAALKGSK